MRCVLYGAVGFLIMGLVIFLLAMWRFYGEPPEEPHNTARHTGFEDRL